MARNRDEDEEIEIPGDDDENVGEGAPKKKREKKRKSKEERIAERRVVFWTLIIILAITVGFWLFPKIGSLLRGEPVIMETEKSEGAKPKQEKSGSKNYVEITL